MNDCQMEAVEALFRGELEQAEAARVSAHVAVCPECKEELRWLERERHFFQSREGAYPPPPSLAEVLAATRVAPQQRPIPIVPAKSAAPGRARWLVLGFGLAAAFLLGAVGLLVPPSPSPEVAADPRSPNAEEQRPLPRDECYACSPASETNPPVPDAGPDAEDCPDDMDLPMCRPHEE